MSCHFTVLPVPSDLEFRQEPHQGARAVDAAEGGTLDRGGSSAGGWLPGRAKLAEVTWPSRIETLGAHQAGPVPFDLAPTRYRTAGPDELVALGSTPLGQPTAVAVDRGDLDVELKELNGRIARLRRDREDGLFDGADDEHEYRKTMGDYLSRRRELRRLPLTESGWRHVATTEQTYREAWEQAGDEGRRRLLLDAGVRFELLSIREWTLSIPADMIARLKKAETQEKAA